MSDAVAPHPPALADFSEFYAAAYGPLCTQLYLHCGSPAEAQDVVQDAFCRALARWKTISTYEDPVAWVRRVAWNLATSRWRRLRRLRDLSPRLVSTSTMAGPDPDRVAVHAALATLPVRQRQAVVLHYLADLSIAEISMMTNAPEGTVKAWLHRGRAQLATVLGTGDVEPADNAAETRPSGSRRDHLEPFRG